MTIIGTTGGVIATSYVTFGENHGWTVGEYFGRSGLITKIGGVAALLLIILSAIYNKWWTIFIVFFAALVITNILIRLFKVYSQLLAVILLLIGVVGFFVYV